MIGAERTLLGAILGRAAGGQRRRVGAVAAFLASPRGRHGISGTTVVVDGGQAGAAGSLERWSTAPSSSSSVLQDLAAAPPALPFCAEAVSARVLVGNPAAGGDGAALVELPAGWRSLEATASPFELIVLEGELLAGEHALGRHGYVSAVPGEAVPALGADWPALGSSSTPSPTSSARPCVPDDEDGWTAGNLPGLRRRMIRGDLDGARGFFLRIPAGWERAAQPSTASTAPEAALQLDGDLWHVRANGGAGGTMRRHCYFWRPRHVLHSPMGSDEGSMAWVYVDGRLVNHYVEEEGGPPAP